MADVTVLSWNINAVVPTFGQGQTGDQKLFYADVTWGINAELYNTGGVPVTAADLKVSALSTLKFFLTEEHGYEGAVKKAYRILFNRETAKLMMLNPDGSEVTDTVDVGAFKFYCVYMGTEA